MRFIAALILVFGLLCFSSIVSADQPAADESADGAEKKETQDVGDGKKDNGETEEYVVSATRVKTPARNVGSSFTVITAEDIARSGKTTVLEVLRGVPGLAVVRQGGDGQVSSVFIRGAKSEHTLVIIDGVEMNDPISPGRAFDFSNLTVDNIERIEVIRGPQSTLYGSDAMGGVINIITKKGKGPPSVRVFGEYGSYNTYREGASVGAGDDWYEASLAVSREDSQGFSAANRRDGNDEKDGCENTTVSSRVSLRPKEWFEFTTALRYVDSSVELDNFGGPGGDDPNYVADTQQIFLRNQAKFLLLDKRWEQIIGYSFSNYSRRYTNDTDPAHPFDSQKFRYHGDIDKIDWQHNLYLHKTNTLTAGFEWERESGHSMTHTESMWGPYTSVFDNQSATMRSYYLQDQICLWDRFTTVLGFRVDDHDLFGTEPTTRVASRYNLKETGTSFHASYGMGFKAPTLYQMFSDYGNPDLGPEKSTGWDAGVEQDLFGDKVTLGATYFRNDFRDFIDFDFASMKYLNIGKAMTKGVELSAAYRPVDCLTLRAWHTLTDSRDLDTGEELLRRPRNVLGAEASLNFLENRANLTLGMLNVGSREDIDPIAWPTQRVTLDRYTLLSLAGSYKVGNHLRLNARLENALNDDYEEVKGYGTPGFSAYFGFEVSF